MCMYEYMHTYTYTYCGGGSLPLHKLGESEREKKHLNSDVHLIQTHFGCSYWGW